MLDSVLLMLSWFKWPVLIFFSVYITFASLVCLWLLYYKRKGIVRKKGNHVKIKKRSVIKRLLYDFPKQYALDLINTPSDFFKYQGLIIYEGNQGSGKTSTMVRDSLLMKEEYPGSKLMTNFEVVGEDEKLMNWRQLVNFKNGHKGVIVCMDELQNWFSSKQSKNFPPEMLSVVTQNRKNRRVIMGTAQRFYMLAKDIRSQCTEIRKCTTLCGCITIVLRKEPVLDSEGNVIEFKHRGIYFHVHNQKLRNSYDTYRVVENLSKAGFKEQTVTEIYNYNSVNVKRK
jgi:uncharacterized protein